jgi:hypothetical protein
VGTGSVLPAVHTVYCVYLHVHPCLQVRPFVVAQRYLTNPLLINGRKFGLRVWVVLTSVDPMRAYLHTNGLVLFSSTVSQQLCSDPPAAYVPASRTSKAGMSGGKHIVCSC